MKKKIEEIKKLLPENPSTIFQDIDYVNLVVEIKKILKEGK